MKNKKITFVLPGYSRVPIGGFKIVFEYANQLIRDGYQVCIFFINKNHLKKYPVPRRLKNVIANYFTQIEPKWFELDNRIKKISSQQKNALSYVENSDFVVATAAITADFVKDNFTNSKKIYLIQGFEKWDMSPEKIYNTYNYGFKNIVVSKWLENIVNKNSASNSIYVPNPIDLSTYTVRRPINKRNDLKIGLLFHSNPVKGSKYALEALKIIKKKYPNVSVEMFGTAVIPKNLPKWISYHKNATQKETIKIYNDISIFISSSIEEGFGLTGLEAMACGAALVSTNYVGVREYAINNYNSLLSPVKDVNRLASNVIYLLDNPSIRILLAKNGVKSASDFSMRKAYEKFKQSLLD